MTRYTYCTTITVTVDMADEGENFEGEPTHWDTPTAQEEAAREYAEQAMPLNETFEEGDWVRVNAPPLALAIPFTLKTWLAALVLSGTIGGLGSSKGRGK